MRVQNVINFCLLLAPTNNTYESLGPTDTEAAPYEHLTRSTDQRNLTYKGITK